MHIESRESATGWLLIENVLFLPFPNILLKQCCFLVENFLLVTLFILRLNSSRDFNLLFWPATISVPSALDTTTTTNAITTITTTTINPLLPVFSYHIFNGTALRFRIHSIIYYLDPSQTISLSLSLYRANSIHQIKAIMNVLRRCILKTEYLTRHSKKI